MCIFHPALSPFFSGFHQKFLALSSSTLSSCHSFPLQLFPLLILHVSHTPSLSPCFSLTFSFLLYFTRSFRFNLPSTHTHSHISHIFPIVSKLLLTSAITSRLSFIPFRHLHHCSHLLPLFSSPTILSIVLIYSHTSTPSSFSTPLYRLLNSYTPSSPLPEDSLLLLLGMICHVSYPSLSL